MNTNAANDNAISAFKTQFSLNYAGELLVDLFAGGGGASTGLEAGLNRPVDIAINHNPKAISMHEGNHPSAKHYISDVWAVDPREATGGQTVGWMHASPDCTHHSQAAGGQPRKKEIRDLSWVVCRWAGLADIRIISLENVKQILNWGPLIAKRDKQTGRVIKMVVTETAGKQKVTHVVAERGERVPRDQQYLVPDPKRKGKTWRQFVRQLNGMGYHVEWRVLKACDFGAPTSRERLFMVARKDGCPISWPEPTHAKAPKKGQKRYRTAAECIDWSTPCPSIFERKKDLAPATLKRIAKGMQKYVLESASPFIVPIANWSNEQVQPSDEPLRTITAYPKGGAFSVAAPVLVQAGHGEGKPGGVQRWGDGSRDVLGPLGTVTASGSGGHSVACAVMVGASGPEYAGKPVSVDKPVGSIMTRNHRAIATAYMAQMNGGYNTVAARDLRDPVSAITSTGSQQQLVTACLAHFRNNCDARDVVEPLHAITANGNHHGLLTAFLSRQFGQSVGQELTLPHPTVTAGGGGKSAVVELSLSPEVEAGALRVAAFLLQYYSEGGQWCELDQPINTITTRDRLALVTVTIAGTPYVIVDIGLRMLQPRELYRAQGFPESYLIEHGHDRKPFTKSEQVHMCGNSVSPPPMAAIAQANNPWNEQRQSEVA